MAENNVDEKLVRWNDIFESMLVDVKTIVKDLSESIGYVAVSAIMTVLVGIAALAMGFVRGLEIGPDLGARYVAFGAIIFFTCLVLGITILRKWYAMRLKYEHLLLLQRTIDSR